MAKARFPGKGSTITVPVYQEPKRGDDESDVSYDERCAEYDARRDIQIEVRMVDRERVVEWDLKNDRLWATERKRRRDAETKNDVIVALSEEAASEWRAFSREVIRVSVVRVFNVIVGDVDLQDVRETEGMIELIDAANLTVDVALAARQAQHPTAQQKKVSESSPAIGASPS